MTTLKQPVLFIGAGSMGSAILRGALEAGTLDAGRLAVADPDADRRADYANAFAGSAEAIDWLVQRDPEDQGIIVLAVKPQSLRAVAREIRPQLEGSQRLIITILAGAPSETVRDVLGGTVRVIRVMPNLPAQVQRGISAIARGAGAREGDEAIARALLEGVGATVEIPERLMDAFTAVAGSGPAYLFYLAEGMLNAAVRLGFEQEVADRIVRATIAGASALLEASAEPASELRVRVTSKGGTTAAALSVFDEARTQEKIIAAIRAARDRGAELAREVR